MHRMMIGLGALLGLLSVAAAAAAAHAVPPGSERAVGSAVQMGGWHALATVLSGLWAERRGGRLALLAGALFLLGALLFGGGVLLSALAGLPTGRAAPVGGTLLMAGWAALGLSAIRRW